MTWKKMKTPKAQTVEREWRPINAELLAEELSAVFGGQFSEDNPDGLLLSVSTSAAGIVVIVAASVKDAEAQVDAVLASHNAESKSAVQIKNEVQVEAQEALKQIDPDEWEAKLKNVEGGDELLDLLKKARGL